MQTAKMVSHAKRMKYVSENEFSSSDDDGETSVDADYTQQNRKNANRSAQNSRGKSKWLSKNAIMARENRLKKKLYVTNLENEVGRLKNENDNFTKVIENQSSLIGELRKQIKYLKSVIANSTDIGNLIKNIHQNTGMSVTTSLDQTLSLNNDYLSKPKQHIARKTAHPWEEKISPLSLESDFHPENDITSLASDDLFSCSGIDDILGISNNVTETFPLDGKEVEDNSSNDTVHLKEHNYTAEEYIDDVGVCLHVSKHRVSVEFCSTCSDGACQAWML